MSDYSNASSPDVTARTTSVPVDGEATYGTHPAGFYFEVSDLPGSDFGPYASIDDVVGAIIRDRVSEFERAAYGLTDRMAHLDRTDWLIFEVRDGERFGRMVPSVTEWAAAGLNGPDAQRAALAGSVVFTDADIARAYGWNPADL